MIEDYCTVSDEVFKIKENYSENYLRQVIAQLGNLDLLFHSCWRRGFDGEEMTAQNVIRILQQHQVKFAYILYGGGNVSIVINGELITKKTDKNRIAERLRHNFFYIE